MDGDEDTELGVKLLNSCDACRSRKVRCIKRLRTDVACINCEKRAEYCRFSPTKKRKVQAPGLQQTTSAGAMELFDISTKVPSPTSGLTSQQGTTTDPSNTIVQHESQAYKAHRVVASTANSTLMSSIDDSAARQKPDASANVASNATSPNKPSGVMTHEQDVSSSCLAFFSDRRIAALSRRLGHTRASDLIRQVDVAVQDALCGALKEIPSPDDCLRDASPVSLSYENRSKFITSYFEEVHPMFPFLNRTEFEHHAFSSSLPEYLSENKEWCVLYYTVLAIGSLYHDYGSFIAFSGSSWWIFRVALSFFPQLVFGRRGLVAAQALAAMAIFGSTYCALPIEDVLITEAGRIAASLRLNNSNTPSPELQRTFWVIYHMEAHFCFNSERSGTIPLSDISCPIPDTPLPQANGLPWLSLLSEYSQIVSRTYENLFSVKARKKSKTSIQEASNLVFDELECWRLSIPEEFRPGLPIRTHRLGNLTTTSLAVQLHFYYYNVRIGALRVVMQTCSDDTEKCLDYMEALAEAAQGIAGLVHLIPLEAFVSPWTQYHMPQSALFILFDLIIESPINPRTKKSLSYLQILVAYFARLAHATGQERLGSVPSQFFHMAATFVQEMEENSTGCLPDNSSSPQNLIQEPQSHQSETGRQEITTDDMFDFQGPPFVLYNGATMGDLGFLFPDPDIAGSGANFNFQLFQREPRFDFME